MTRQLKDSMNTPARFVGPIPVTFKDPEGKEEDKRGTYEGWYNPITGKVTPVRVEWQRPTEEEIRINIEAAAEGREAPGTKIRRYQPQGPHATRFGLKNADLTEAGPAAAPPTEEDPDPPAAVTRPNFDALIREAGATLVYGVTAAAVVTAVKLARRIRRG